MDKKSLSQRNSADNSAVPPDSLIRSELPRLFGSTPGSVLTVRLMELLPAAVYTCDAPSGVITYYNRRAAELWGRAPAIGDTDERFCGSLRLFQPDGKPLPHAETPMAQVLGGAAPVRSQEVVIERPNGSRITVLVNIDPLTNALGETIGAINVFADVTELKQAERARRQLAAIVESSEDAIISKDLNGIIASWNQAAARLFGYTAEEMIGKPITLLIPPERHDEEPGILESIRRGERLEHYETIRRRKDGSLVDVSLTVSPIRDTQGNIVGASKIARNITQRKRVEGALRESEERFRTLAMNAPAAIFIKDIAGRYTLANPLACQALGRVDGVVGLTDNDLLPQEVADSLRRHDAEVISTGRAIEREEIVQRAGFSRNYLSVKFPLRDSRGQVIGVCGVAIDITQRKLMEKALRESEERLREQAQELEQQLIMSGRLVSLGEVTASMAHEFNNPLGIIMGFVEDMLSGMEPADPNYRALQIIDEESKRCRQIVKDLMEYARPRSIEFCSTSITDAIDKTLQLVANRLYKQNVAVEKKLKPNLPRIQADAQQLEQVLVNLYLNAIDAMPEGGKLIVEAEFAQSGDTPPMVVITVADTGFGIAETDLPKIFQPFFTAKKRRGMGLGLPICQRIINNHGGTIVVESVPGAGSTFKIYLPSEQRATTKSQEPRASEASARISTSRTLS